MEPETPESSPYRPPVAEEVSADDLVARTAARLRWPAIFLGLASVLSILLLVPSFLFSVWLIASGTLDELGGSNRYQVVGIRLTWNLILSLSSVLVLVGAVNMYRLKNFASARLACTLAMIPCVTSPCLIVGIPFGIWGYLVLNSAETGQAFES